MENGAEGATVKAATEKKTHQKQPRNIAISQLYLDIKDLLLYSLKSYNALDCDFWLFDQIFIEILDDHTMFYLVVTFIQQKLYLRFW